VSIVRGGRRFAKNRLHLLRMGLTEQQPTRGRLYDQL
jgi:hypothetical protein